MKATSTVLTAYGYKYGKCVIEFTEKGYNVIEDNRDIKVGYLHVYENEGSANEITDLVRDQIIKYFYNHDIDLPGIGSTPQKLYMQGLTLSDREKIAGVSKAYYA